MIAFDMDGVLMLYSYDRFREINGKKWYEEGRHVFKDCIPDPFMKQIFSRLITLFPDDVYVYTSVSGDGGYKARNEQIMDKMHTLMKHYPEFNLCNFIVTESSKREHLSRIKGSNLAKTDIIIEDWKKNVWSWQIAGGSSIKYINDINSRGDWPGPIIQNTMQVDEAVSIILQLIYNNS